MNDLGAYYERHRRHIGAAWQPACTDTVASTKWIGGRLTRPFGVTLAKLASRGSSMLQLGSAEERTSAEHSATLKVAQRLGLLGESD